MFRTCWTIALAAALGCGGAAPNVPPTLRGATVHYAPLTMRDDARRPTQAVVLGTDDGDGSTVLPLPAARQVTVDAPAGRGTVAIALTAGPALTGDGATILGTVAGPDPINDRWNAALWTAALATAAALGKDLPDLALTATPAPRATATALIAAGWLASATGEAADPAATVIGELGPDGGVLASDGMADQLAAALARGKTRIGVPIGAAALIAQARGHHAEAIELATVHDAYQVLTRKRLPAALPVAEADMAIDADTTRALDALYLGWQRRVATEWAALLQAEQAGRRPPALAALDRRAHAASEQAEALHRAGKPVAAYARIVDAWVCAAAVTRARGVVRAVAAGHRDDALAQLTGAAPDEPSLASVLDKLGALRPSSVTGHLAMLDGFQAALRGWGDQRAAIAAIATATALLAGPEPGATPGASSDAAAAAIAPAIERMLRAAAEAATADEQLAMAPDQGAAAVPPRLARLSPALTAAAAALVAALDRATGSPELAIAAVLAAPLDGLPRDRIAAWGDAPASELLVLAGHVEALHAARVVGVRRAALGPDALRPVIAIAARSARAAARAARIATGAIPLRARLAYQHAAALGDDPVAALAALWAATDASRTAAMLARN